MKNEATERVRERERERREREGENQEKKERERVETSEEYGQELNKHIERKLKRIHLSH